MAGQTPFNLVYGQEAVMPMEYIVPILQIVVVTRMCDEWDIEERLDQLLQLEENRFIEGFHQRVEKDRQKGWHDHYIKTKHFQHGDMVIIYEKKFLKHPGKLQMHWLGPYIINDITNEGAV